MTVVLLLLAACLLRLTSGSQCGNLTQAAPEGPHFVRYVGSKHRLAPDTELEDPAMAVILRGRVLDRHCDPLPGAVVDIWYVGQAGRYNRGQALTNKVIIIHDIMYFHQVLIFKKLQIGEYEFLASFPTVNREKAIPHYNIKVGIIELNQLMDKYKSKHLLSR